MAYTLRGKKAVIFGGSRGIGSAAVKKIAAEGAEVIIVYNNGKAQAKATANEIAEAGGKAHILSADITDIPALTSVFDHAEKLVGKLDIVVSTAGIVSNKPVLEYTIEDYDKAFDTNTKSTFFIMQEAVKRINNGGRIIVTSSGGTRLLLSGTTMYLGTKGAIEQFVRGFAMEVGDRNITVNAVSPGYTHTDMLGESEFNKIAANQSPFKRLGEPEDIGDVIAFLCSDEACWITAQNIGVGGGVM